METLSKASALSRRQLLLGGGAFALATLAPRLSRAAPQTILRAAPHTTQILPGDWPATPTWAYSAQNPGPVLRVKQGERLRVMLQNDLQQDRKSTRLNSSHRCNSYAVFCLKKTKNKNKNKKVTVVRKSLV